MDSNNITKLRKEVVAFLKERSKSYDDTDTLLIDQLMNNVKWMNEAAQAINEHGYSANVTRDARKQPFIQLSRHFAAYNQFLKNFLAIIQKLGLSPTDRAKLKMLLVTEVDEFDSAMED